MDFIDPRGDLRYRATPFADESDDRDVQPARGQHRPLGSGHRHLRRAAGRPVNDPTPSISEDGTALAAPPWAAHRGSRSSSILLITVLTDLPVSTSRADDISAERSVMSEVNTDLGPCALAVHQAVGIWNLQAAHALTPADRAPTPGPAERRSDSLLLHEREHLRPGRTSRFPGRRPASTWASWWRPRRCGPPRTPCGRSRTCRR